MSGIYRVTVSPQMLVSAVRYALNRATYVVGETVDQVIGVWADLPEGVRNAIERDVRAEIRMAEIYGGTVGHACDHRAWQRLLDHIEALPT